MLLKDLFEYEDLSQEKQSIIDRVSGLSTTPGTPEAALLDRIYRILGTEDISTKISTAFTPAMSDETTLSDKAKQQHKLNLTKIILNLDSDYPAMNAFLKRMEKGGVIDISQLTQPISSFNKIFNGDPVAINAFNAFKLYGVGQRQKGPGEFALAMLSNQIKLAAVGDLEISGIGKVELKAETTKGGGRLGDSGASQEQQMVILEKYAEYIPFFIDYLKQGGKGGGGSIGIGEFVVKLNQELPITGTQNVTDEEGNVIKTGISGPEAKKLRVQIASELLTPTFKTYAAAIASKFAQESASEIEYEYVKQNFEWYKNRDGFDAFLLINFPRQKTMTLGSGDDVATARKNNQLVNLSISIIGTKSGATREQFAQMSMSASKVE